MDWVSWPENSVGPTANRYPFPFVSVTEATWAVVSFQPTTTTFRFPADWARAYGTLTLIAGVCGVASFSCTKAMAVAASRETDNRPSPEGPHEMARSRGRRQDELALRQ